MVGPVSGQFQGFSPRTSEEGWFCKGSGGNLLHLPAQVFMEAGVYKVSGVNLNKSL